MQNDKLRVLLANLIHGTIVNSSKHLKLKIRQDLTDCM